MHNIYITNKFMLCLCLEDPLQCNHLLFGSANTRHYLSKACFVETVPREDNFFNVVYYMLSVIYDLLSTILCSE